jgi:hypothetical protein
MYKQIKIWKTEEISNEFIMRVLDGACIPFDPANTDYANFKKEVLAGAELQDATGNVMTQEQANAFIATLP